MSPQLNSQIGTILCRGIVPAWVATGAIFKLIEATPKLLPEKTVLAFGKLLDSKLGFELMTFLASLIAIEFVGVIVMVLLAKYARCVAIFVLSVFCLVLIGEMVQGNFKSCGCLGGISTPPWAILIVDGSLLIGVLFFKPVCNIAAQPRRWSLLLAAVLSFAGIALSFGIIISKGKAPDQVGNGGTTIPVDPTINPNPKPLKGTWYVDDIDALVGMPWRDIEIFQFMPKWPRNMDEGKHYVVFYSRACDHCQEMFDYDLTDPELTVNVTAVEIPIEKNLMRSESTAWPMPETDCELMSLPLGCDWVITPPLTFRIEDGVVTCAVEGGHSVCMELGPEDH